jgi:AcrR family transcriptional regulator
VLRAAASAFVAGGFDGTSMDDVGRAAGVTRLIVYRIFESKELLYRAVLDGVALRLIDEFADADLTDAEARVLRVARADEDAFRLLWRHSAHEPAFSGYVSEVRSRAADYVGALLGGRIDASLRRWAIPAVIDHVFTTTLIWLDHGDAIGDDDFVHRHRAGTRALVDAWTRPP